MLIVLYIFAGIVALFALVLSIRAHVRIAYEKDLTAYVSWAFLKIPLLPLKDDDGKKKKPKKAPAKKPQPEKEADKQTAREKPVKKGKNPLAVLYENEKLHGIIELLQKLLAVIGKFGRRFVNSFIIDELLLDIGVSGDDAAETAEDYGKMCQYVFPVVGAVCANCNVKRYGVNVYPDFLAEGHNKYEFSLEISLSPRKLINSVLLFAFGAVFKVGIRFIKGIKPKAAVSTSADNAQNAAAANANANVADKSNGNTNENNNNNTNENNI